VAGGAGRVLDSLGLLITRAWCAVAELPFGIAVEIEMVLEVSD
jgi:hypothetical protein